MVLWTWPTLPRLRLRFALLDDARCRNPGFRRRILPVAVILNRLATAFFVLRRAIAFGMGGGKLASARERANFFLQRSSTFRCRDSLPLDIGMSSYAVPIQKVAWYCPEVAASSRRTG